MKSLQLRSYLLTFFVFLCTALPAVDIIAGKQITTFKTGKTPDGIGWANL